MAKAKRRTFAPWQRRLCAPSVRPDTALPRLWFAPTEKDCQIAIGSFNPQLAGVLLKTCNLFASTLLKELLKKVSQIAATVDNDAFGLIA